MRFYSKKTFQLDKTIINKILNLIVDETLKPHISKVHEFDQALQALDELKARKSIGKFIVRGPKSKS